MRTHETCRHYRSLSGPAFHGRCRWPDNILGAIPEWVRRDAMAPLVIADAPTDCEAWSARDPEPLALWMRKLDYKRADMSALHAWMESARG